MLLPTQYRSNRDHGFAYGAICGAKLSGLLVSTYHLMFKSHLYHWSLVGPMFGSLHILAQSHHAELAAGAEAIRQRLAALGHGVPPAPELDADFSGRMPKVQIAPMLEIVEDLGADHAGAMRQIEAIEMLADEAEDLQTLELMMGRHAFHTEALTMLAATLRHQ